MYVLALRWLRFHKSASTDELVLEVSTTADMGIEADLKYVSLYIFIFGRRSAALETRRVMSQKGRVTEMHQDIFLGARIRTKT